MKFIILLLHSCFSAYIVTNPKSEVASDLFVVVYNEESIIDNTLRIYDDYRPKNINFNCSCEIETKCTISLNTYNCLSYSNFIHLGRGIINSYDLYKVNNIPRSDILQENVGLFILQTLFETHVEISCWITRPEKIQSLEIYFENIINPINVTKGLEYKTLQFPRNTLKYITFNKATNIQKKLQSLMKVNLLNYSLPLQPIKHINSISDSNIIHVLISNNDMSYNVSTSEHINQENFALIIPLGCFLGVLLLVSVRLVYRRRCK